ncbi:MAG: hypothetical protein WCO84_01640 [bacterium]
MIKKNRQFYTLKLTSGYLAEFNNKVELSFRSAKKYSRMIALADSQMLRTIRKVCGKAIDYADLETWYDERDKLKRKSSSGENAERISELQHNIDEMLFIPQYVTVVMETKKHYEKLFKDGFDVVVDGECRSFRRLSCSASQARTSTVVFCDISILDKVVEILDNGRNKQVPISSAKFNAYFGLYSSASKIVSTPKFCVVPDFENKKTVTVNHVTETAKNDDDLIEVKDIELAFNRTDGMGLINYEKASLWASELGLDYVPAEWCIRQSFTKGMLATFPIQEFCEVVGGGNFQTKDVYGNLVDLREIDVILTESQFKLWNAYPNLDYYQSCCKENDLSWGVAIYTPKEDKNILKLNYQFLQTLDLSDEDISEVCQQFIRWISDVNFDNVASALLFLLGGEHSENSIRNYLKSSDAWWIKCLLLDNGLIEDKYFKQKIYNLLKTKINNACLGQIIVDGNFQVLISDPYAMMQHVLGMEVSGLLKEGEFYSNYWNERNVSQVDGMRSPMTYRSEHVLMNLRNDTTVNYWYRYLTSGIILNYYGHETMNFAGSDKICRLA